MAAPPAPRAPLLPGSRPVAGPRNGQGRRRGRGRGPRLLAVMVLLIAVAALLAARFTNGAVSTVTNRGDGEFTLPGGSCFRSALIVPTPGHPGAPQWTLTIMLKNEPAAMPAALTLIGTDTCRAERQQLLDEASRGISPPADESAVTVSYLTPNGARIVTP